MTISFVTLWTPLKLYIVCAENTFKAEQECKKKESSLLIYPRLVIYSIVFFCFIFGNKTFKKLWTLWVRARIYAFKCKTRTNLENTWTFSGCYLCMYLINKSVTVVLEINVTMFVISLCFICWQQTNDTLHTNFKRFLQVYNTKTINFTSSGLGF